MEQRRRYGRNPNRDYGRPARFEMKLTREESLLLRKLALAEGLTMSELIRRRTFGDMQSAA